MEYKDIVFIAKENMTSVCEITDISNLPEFAYRHFMEYDEEILYVLDRGKMFGVVSIGDLEKFYNEEKNELKVNQKYTFANTIDFHAATNFFGRVKTVNEMPIVVDKKELIGIIKYSKNEQLRIQQKEALKSAKMGKALWDKNEICKFVNKTKAKVFFYTISTKSINEKINKELLQKHNQENNNKDWMGLSKEDWGKYWKLEYEEGIVYKMKTELESCRLVMKNGIGTFTDMEGEIYSFEHGYRVTPNNPPKADRRIFMYGPCIVFGYYCKNNQTIAAYLQDQLNESNYTDWKVLNKGQWGLQTCYYPMFVEKLSENDIVLFWCMEEWLPKRGINKSISLRDLTEIFTSIPSLLENIVDNFWHCNYMVNQKLAEIIFKDLYNTKVLDSPKQYGTPEKIQDYYIGWDIYQYFMEYLEKYDLRRKTEYEKIGAIVMNCNPFTKGHRYLIDKALEIVDYLYIFVVEEDKSYFSFNERFEMVKLGVKELTNVIVIPSGKYILSKDTFAQYFEKEQVQEIESMDYDIYIFGEVIASMLGICYRFVGTEPYDKVTKEYNETMKRILPKFGMKIVEIPRLESDQFGGVISATLVRKAVKEKNIDMIKAICPTNVAEYIINNYQY